MGQEQREQLKKIAREPERLRQTVRYLREHMQAFLHPRERVLMCFSDEAEGMGELLAQVVRELDAEPYFWGPDLSWQALLRQAFFSRPGTIIGPPLIVLGLSKVAMATSTPLAIRNVMLAGAPSEAWMVEGIQKGLDAAIWGCYDPIPGSVVGGFSCEMKQGVHIWQDAVDIRVVDESGQDAAEGELGQVIVSLTGDPSVRFATGEMAAIMTGKCQCGCEAPRLVGFRPMKEPDPALDGLQEQLLTWTSVLDYNARRTEMGLELEIVAFPGQRLPTLPGCAKRVVRPWMPKHDIPFLLMEG